MFTGEEASGGDAPADVVALLEYADLQGMRYRDFSASRREYRAGIRQRAALARRDAEAKAKAQAEQAAAEAERGARQANEAARFYAAQARLAAARLEMDVAAAQEAARGRALVQAEQLSRQAAMERTAAARHAEALRTAEQTARHEAAELTQARISRQPVLEMDEACSGSDDMEGLPQARSTVRPSAEDRTEAIGAMEGVTSGMSSLRTPLKRDANSLLTVDEDGAPEDPEVDRTSWDAASGNTPILLPKLSAAETAAMVEQYARSIWQAGPGTANDSVAGRVSDTPELLQGTHRGTGAAACAESNSGAEQRSASHDGQNAEEAEGAPSWLAGLPRSVGDTGGRSPVRESLQRSREAVAARWYALRGLFDPTATEDKPAEFKVEQQAPPVLAIYSVAGGVGKTSLAASLTRALAAQGERVLLVEATQRGILPFYLGGRELRPEVIRTFAPPAGSIDQPIHLVSYGTDVAATGPEQDGSLTEKIKRDGTGFSRVIVDVPSAASDLLESLIQFGAEVLVPIAPDMNSIITLPAVRRSVGRISAGTAKRVDATFLLVQFDPSQPLQVDVREVLQQQLGDDLLPFAVRRSPSIAEALAEGMTVMDYAPGEGIARDYLQVASWLRAQAKPAREGVAQARWSER